MYYNSGSGGQYQDYKQQLGRMINQITINFNNAIDLSRGELLNWVNDLLKTSLTKIQQLGTGAIYCQLTDILYPGKLPMAKVNWKAKFEYQFVSNFKILQQTFTKLGIMKHIDVEKLIKCKYQDNLEFLQWFRKIFDINANAAKDYNPLSRRGDQELQKIDKVEKKREKENKAKEFQRSNSKTFIELSERSGICDSFLGSDKADSNQPTLRRSDCYNSVLGNHGRSVEDNFAGIDFNMKAQLKNQAFEDEREFYLKKFKEIQHLCEEWKTDRPSSQLIEHIRKIILVAPEIDWGVVDGQYVERSWQPDEEAVPACNQ